MAGWRETLLTEIVFGYCVKKVIVEKVFSCCTVDCYVFTLEYSQKPRTSKQVHRSQYYSPMRCDAVKSTLWTLRVAGLLEKCKIGFSFFQRKKSSPCWLSNIRVSSASVYTSFSLYMYEYNNWRRRAMRFADDYIQHSSPDDMIMTPVKSFTVTEK